MPDTIENDSMRKPPAYNPDKGAQVLTGDTARQGPAGKRGLTVMVTSTIGAIVIMALAFLVFRMMG